MVKVPLADGAGGEDAGPSATAAAAEAPASNKGRKRGKEEK